MSKWTDQLQPASFRTIAFAVRNSRASFGRRNVVHEYPFRDTPWVEDMGRATRVFRVVGFIVENDLGKGSSAIATRNALVAACEKQDTGQLVHPTYGAFNASLISLDVEEAWDQGRVFGLQFTFVEAGALLFPSASASTTSIGKVSALQAFVSAAIDLKAKIQGYYNQGAAVVRQVELTTQTLVRQVQDIQNDATNIYNFVSNLPGAIDGTYGRFFGGNTKSGLIQTPNPFSTATLAQLIAQGSANRAAIGAATDTLTTASQGVDSDALADAMQQVVAAILTSAIDPADGIRLLQELTSFEPPSYSTTAPIGVAINGAADAVGDLFRRSAVIAIAQAALAYQPSSYDDAASLRFKVTSILDNEIEIAGDQGEDNTFTSLRALRAAVSLDLAIRGASLAPIMTFKSNRPIPAPVWALRLYRDVSRSDSLVAQADPVHPMFMPISFKALGS